GTRTRALKRSPGEWAAAPTAANFYRALGEPPAPLVPGGVLLFGAGRNPAAETEAPQPVQAAIASIQRGAALTTTVSAAGDTWLIRRVSSRTPDFGVLAIDLGHMPAVDDIRRRVDDALADASATLERLDVARALNEAKMRSETELLREALIGSVSHELRTPLAAIMGAATVLRGSPAVAQDERLHSLAGVVRDEAERLNNDIQ